MGSYGSRPGSRVHGLEPVAIAPVMAFYGVELDDRGNELVRCPVHGESRPSCSVSTSKGLYHCFACGSKGTAINLIMDIERCDRAAAIAKADVILRASGYELPTAARQRYTRPDVPGKPGDKRSGRKYVPPGRRS